MSEIKIALCGRMRSGKDTVGDILARDYGLQRIAFGDGVRELARAYFPHKLEPVYADCPFSEGGTRVAYERVPRTVMQTLGQHMRAYDPDIWVKRAERTAELLADSRSYNGIVITDLRQPDEFEWAKANGYTIIRVNADEDVRKDRARLGGVELTVEQLNHETESHVDSFEVDYEIDNGEGVSLADLERVVGDIMGGIEGGS